MRSLTLVASLLLSGLCSGFTGPSDKARFKFYNTPSKGGVCDGDVGPDGVTLWYQDLLANTVGRLNYLTGAIDEWPVPFQKNRKSTSPQVLNVTALACVVRTGKDGKVYGGAGIHNELVVIDPGKSTASKHVGVYIYSPANQNPAGNLENFNDAWAANDGLWFSQVSGNVISVFSYHTHLFKSFKAHTPASGPLGMRTDKYNNLWYTNFFGQFISVINTKTHAITEYTTCCLTHVGLFPEVLRSSTENQKYLWANAFGSGGYIRIEPDAPDADKFKVFLNPNGMGTFPFENSNDYCGRIWYTSPVQNILVYYDPPKNKWTTVTVPGIPIGGNFEVIMHRGPGHYMWFCETVTNKIGRYTLDKSCKGEPQ